MSSLPPELILNVLAYLYDGLYFPDETTRRTLLSMCSASRMLRELTIPLLYSCIRIVLPRACEDLAHSPHVSKYLTSISVTDPHHWGRHFLNHIPALCSLLTHARHTLRTIILSLPLRGVTPEEDPGDVKQLLRYTLDSIPHLETFVSCQDELFLRSREEVRARTNILGNWTGMFQLRRLALNNADISEEFADACLSLPHLEVVVLLNPYFDLAHFSLRGLIKLLGARPTGALPLQVVIVSFNRVDWHAPMYDANLTHFIANEPCTNLRWIRAATGYANIEERTRSFLWLRGLAERGELWQLRSEGLTP